MSKPIWKLHRGTGPIVATAIHDGHNVREEILSCMKLSDSARLREEDPYTSRWAKLAPTWLVGLQSRFEFDLNRPREKAVYINPDDAWGLDVWKEKLPEDLIQQSLKHYDAFYAELEKLYRGLSRKFGRFLVLDFHSYNHKRDGADGPPAESSGNPQINIGTGTMLDRKRWAPLIDRFISDLAAYDFPGGKLDVRENVKFRGGACAAWTHRTFPDSACVLSIEVKKFFMDEWTGELDDFQFAEIGNALKFALAGATEELTRLSKIHSSGISDQFIRTVKKRISEGKRVRRNLPDWGRLAVDRSLPFLCVYRRPSRSKDDSTFRLVTSEASYLTCSAHSRQHDGIRRLVSAIYKTQTEKYGRFMLLEIWSGSRTVAPGGFTKESQRPSFTIFAPRENGYEFLSDKLEETLGKIKIGSLRANVTTVEKKQRWPKGMKPILSNEVAANDNVILFGLEVSPIFFDIESDELYPVLLRELRRKLSISLRRFFFDFARSSTFATPAHFHVFGKRAVVQSVWKCDSMLASASESFEFLLQLTPVNGEQAWHRFKKYKYQKPPVFHYRPLVVDPVVLKRQLFKAPVERVEDPALALVFRQKLDEIDRQITMLQDRNTDRFLHESIQLFGDVDDDLNNLAIDVLTSIPPRSRDKDATGHINADTFAKHARKEIANLKSLFPDVEAKVEVREDVTGLLVSKGHLLISSHSRIPMARLNALIQHEVGTHVLTYQNGKAQKFRLLSTGLAGYDSLQEGLAVLSEYLVGGLSRPRLRLLAGRVVAVRCLLDGASFIDTFRELNQKHKFSGRNSFTITMRVFRSGGLTKDAVYLLGLQQILDYISKGGELHPLFVGKIATEHIPLIRELTWRGVLKAPPLIPLYMSQPDALQRLEKLQSGIKVANLLKGRRK